MSTLVTLEAARAGLLASVAGRSKFADLAAPAMSTATDKRSDHRHAAVLPAAAATGPRLLFFDVPGRRDLAQRGAAAAPGVRFAARRSWTEDPGEPRRSLLGGDPPVGLWHWKGTAEEFAAQAADILLGFVHPLVARDLPFCIGFSFGAEVLAPRSLSVGEAAALDLEDIGRLLGAAAARRPGSPSPPPQSFTAASSGAPPLAAPAPAASAGPASPRRPASGPGRGAARRRPARGRRALPRTGTRPGSGGLRQDEDTVSRVVELVDRGADPAGILMLAFNRKAAEQLEERLAALGIRTTRRLGSPPDARVARRRRPSLPTPSGVLRAATANVRPASTAPPSMPSATATSVRSLRARFSLDHDGRSLRALMVRAMETAGVSLRELKPRRGSDPVGAFMNGLTRVRARPRARGRRRGAGRVRHRDADRHHPLRGHPRAVHSRSGCHRPAVLRRPDLLRRRRHARRPCTPRLHPGPVRPRAGGRVPGPQRRATRPRGLLSRPHRRLFVVGDDDQLIYGWRQADPRGILEFHRRMPPKPWSATYTLCTNYRCSRAVVETGARLVANNRVREAKEIRPRAGAQDGAVRFFGDAGVAGARRGRSAPSCARRRRGSPATGATSPCSAATARSSCWSRSHWTPATCRGRRPWGASCSRMRRRGSCAPTCAWCARRTSCPPRVSRPCSAGRTAARAPRSSKPPARPSSRGRT